MPATRYVAARRRVRASRVSVRSGAQPKAPLGSVSVAPSRKSLAVPPASRTSKQAADHVPGIAEHGRAAIQAAVGHVAHHERGRAHPPVVGAGAQDGLDQAHVVLDRHLEAEGRAQHRPPRIGAARDPDPALVAVGAGAAPRPEQIVVDRIVGDPDLGPALDQIGESDRPVGQAAQEVGGAVDRIDHPEPPLARTAAAAPVAVAVPVPLTPVTVARRAVALGPPSGSASGSPIWIGKRVGERVGVTFEQIVAAAAFFAEHAVVGERGARAGSGSAPRPRGRRC